MLISIDCGDIELNPGPQGTPVSHENTLSIFHANIRSLRNKLNYIIDIVEDSVIYVDQYRLKFSFKFKPHTL
jgi:hypothetical protein